MRIGQKNTLFVVALILLVLGGVAVSGFYLIKRHVNTAIDADLKRAHAVFVQAEKDAFARMLSTARGIAREPALVAALLTGDAATVRSMLEDLYPRPGIDLLALYPVKGGGESIAEGRKPHFTSRQVLASKPIRELVERILAGQPEAYGNALIFDTFLRLGAIPVESPLGGVLGVLVTGEEVAQPRVETLKQLVRADVALFQGNVILGSTLPDGGTPYHELAYPDERRMPLRFQAGGQDYLGHVYRVLAGDGATTAAHLLLAHSADSYWAPYRELGKRGLMFSALVLLVAALLGIGISRATLARPIMQLAATTRSIASGGDLEQRVSLRHNDELGELAQSFNRMLEHLSASRAELERNRQRFRDFAQSSSDWLWETDDECRLVYVSPGVTQCLGVRPEHFVGRHFAEIFPNDDIGALSERICPQADRHYPFKDFELCVTLPDGDRRYLRMNGMPVLEEGAFRGYRGTASDITKVRQHEERLSVLANQDQLTGLTNRRRFLVDLAHEIRRAQARGGHGILMLIDLDHLKMINDTAGHAVGDEIIVQVAGVLTAQSRGEDLVARVSGDEFAVAFPEMTLEQAKEKAAQILEAIGECKPRQTKLPVSVSASIGMVMFPDQASEAVELMALADTAMYAAKDAGRNRIRCYSEGDMARERMGTLLASRNQVMEALEQDRFELVFQPIASVLDGGIHHFETLVRIRDAHGNQIMPGTFIPAAEQFGLIGRVDRVIVRKALKRLAALPEARQDIGISINLSGLSVGDSDMLAYIEREVAAAGVAPERITFEVTETAACENMARAAEFIGRIGQMGCKISLDDFGVGFSSFSYLKNLDVDYLKIDGSFIRDIVRSHGDRLFVKALVDVARGMGIRTIAEFVESREAFTLLRRIGVDYVQGYYIGRPGPEIAAKPLEIPEDTPVSQALAG